MEPGSGSSQKFQSGSGQKLNPDQDQDPAKNLMPDRYLLTLAENDIKLFHYFNNDFLIKSSQLKDMYNVVKSKIML